MEMVFSGIVKKKNNFIFPLLFAEKWEYQMWAFLRYVKTVSTIHSFFLESWLQ